MGRRLVLLIWVFVLAQSAFGLTLGDIETQIRRHVRDTATDSTLQRYTDTILDAHINEAQRDVVNASWCLQRSTTITLSANTTYYDLPTDLISIRSAYFTDSNGRTYELEAESDQTYRKNNPDYMTQSGDPANYFVRYSTVDANPSEISFVPIVTNDDEEVHLTYYNQSTNMTSDTDVPFDGLNHLYPYHETLVYNVVYKIKLIEGLINEAKAYNDIYNALIQTLIKRFDENPNYFPSINAGRN